jgi:nitroimidazol reductase NimA-like FMN-containing flavoprotein (pyridoxamine 5'-phosphate oxidase superfamily)
MEFDGVGAEVLTRAECLRLLSTTELGRVGISVKALPAIVPVRFALDGGEIVFRAAPGTALDAATRGAIVAFEADGVEPGAGAWSVLATGAARHVAEPAERLRASRLPLRAWSSTQPDRVVAVSPQLLSGRRRGDLTAWPDSLQAAATSEHATRPGCRARGALPG